MLLRVVIRVATKRDYCHGGVHALRVFDDASFYGSDVVVGMFMAGPPAGVVGVEGQGRMGGGREGPEG